MNMRRRTAELADSRPCTDHNSGSSLSMLSCGGTTPARAICASYTGQRRHRDVLARFRPWDEQYDAERQEPDRPENEADHRQALRDRVSNRQHGGESVSHTREHGESGREPQRAQRLRESCEADRHSEGPEAEEELTEVFAEQHPERLMLDGEEGGGRGHRPP